MRCFVVTWIIQKTRAWSLALFVALAAAPAADAAPTTPLRARAEQPWTAALRKRQAAREFNSFVAARPKLQQIYAEEKERETVATARGTMWIALGIAATNLSLATHWTSANVLIAAANLYTAKLAWDNQSSKIAKARGSTLSRALKLAPADKSVVPPPGAIDRWLEAGLVRHGDLHE
jgi:hypothetical protein